jgi:hypothetical protein
VVAYIDASEDREDRERKKMATFTLKMISDYQVFKAWEIPEITDQTSAEEHILKQLADKDKKGIRKLFVLSASNLPEDINRSEYITF